ncbi:MAG: sigma-54-dependent Fis family transcriptional regulator [Rhodoferax sp.]|uniref:sigma-54-dependent transcriptional regulator n=1 Tax=Rhodoferax sp. TaxID=50421 RepID=UPI0014018663|nr:sigma-54 dependent transcriptional regulator [Rhodoferax sp.]NDP40541.1 sigma-54-dependent Fis family transcriptional regulator [Rhodoferax sp.]
MASNTTLSGARILVVDDEPDLRTLYELTLLREGYRVETAANLAEALQHIGESRFDVVITDMRLPDGLGLELIQQLRARKRPERCVVITAYGSAGNAVESLKAGAFDYLTKPVDLKQFRTVIVSALQEPAPRAVPVGRVGLPPPESSDAVLQRLVGESDSMRRVKERIVKVARSMAPVLVHGESGTGKELVARAIHASSHRTGSAWVAVNCSAIPESLLEAEFFGSKKGAYTGSTQDRDGFFQAANGGTLFLDEIGDLPLSMQSKLLRAVQERCIRPIGSPQEEPVDVRIISATHKDLGLEVLAGRFRQDLYYRLDVIEIEIPPLRERREDLPALCQALLRRIAAESGMLVPPLSKAALEQLSHDPLPGNVRELENLLQRAVALCDSDELHLDLDVRQPSTQEASFLDGDAAPLNEEQVTIPSDLQGHLDSQEREILMQALRETGFNRTAAAARLGLSLRQIGYRMARLSIDAPHSGELSDESL